MDSGAARAKCSALMCPWPAGHHASGAGGVGLQVETLEGPAAAALLSACGSVRHAAPCAACDSCLMTRCMQCLSTCYGCGMLLTAPPWAAGGEAVIVGCPAATWPRIADLCSLRHALRFVAPGLCRRVYACWLNATACADDGLVAPCAAGCTSADTFLMLGAGEPPASRLYGGAGGYSPQCVTGGCCQLWGQCGGAER